MDVALIDLHLYLGEVRGDHVMNSLESIGAGVMTVACMTVAVTQGLCSSQFSGPFVTSM